MAVSVAWILILQTTVRSCIRSRLCVWGIYAGVTYCTIAILLNKLSDGIEIDADTSNGQDDCDDPGHNHKTKGKGEELSTGLDDDSDVSFFPLLYPKQLPRKFYKASDPEWQEFKKLQSDKDRKNAARGMFTWFLLPRQGC